MLRVLMYPHLSNFDNEESGIRRVIEAYNRYLPQFGFQIVEADRDDDDAYDIMAVHAGTHTRLNPRKPLVSILHGLYWTADYGAPRWEWETNASVISTIRAADVITVPSEWVAETLRRDIRKNPYVVPHGIEADLWTHNHESQGYVLWNKNRNMDVCNPKAVGILASARQNVHFVTTFPPEDSTMSGNIEVIGVKSHGEMKEIVQKAGVYLSTTKETFGIGVLEAMAAGVPVLGFAHGGNLGLVEHGVNGYLARPDDYSDLLVGLDYCLEHRAVLGTNGKALVKKWTWEKGVAVLADALREAYNLGRRPPAVSVVIPSYNYADKVGRAIESALNQTHPADSIVVVDDGSTDNGATRKVVEEYSAKDKRVVYIYQDNAGVANARNAGIAYSDTKYVCCLDADDAIEPQFLEACVKGLEGDKSLGIAYTGLQFIKPDGATGLSEWPGQYNFDAMLRKQNQVPTCCVFRREMWSRLGGYKQRYAPMGAGSEDAEFWLRAGLYGWKARKVTDAGLFVYSWLSGRVSGNKDYKEVDWTYWHPEVQDRIFKFACVATPENHVSHPVRQYDMPSISVIIPVGEGHEKHDILHRALDSLEGQTLRDWEAIVVFDGQDKDDPVVKSTLTSHPYLRTVFTGKRVGAGAARNRGAEIARARMILFLDADDWMYPSALMEMRSAYESTGEIVYSDYDGKSYISKDQIEQFSNVLLNYNEKTGEAVLKYRSARYDCEEAVAQPNAANPYIWCLVTALTPLAWHREIGGFDEQMESWEDWDYWIRMARAGKCFTRIDHSLIVYRFYTGNRRELGIKDNQKLLKYLVDKYQGERIMPCNCGGGKTVSPSMTLRFSSSAPAMTANQPTDASMVLVRYTSQNRGQHKVTGRSTGISYGYHGGGEVFYVHQTDIALQPFLFEPIGRGPEPIEDALTPEPKLLATQEVVEPEPEKPTAAPPYDMQSIPGVSQPIADQLAERNIFSLEDIVKVGIDGLTELKGVGKTRATAIYNYAKERTK